MFSSHDCIFHVEQVPTDWQFIFSACDVNMLPPWPLPLRHSHSCLYTRSVFERKKMNFLTGWGYQKKLLENVLLGKAFSDSIRRDFWSHIRKRPLTAYNLYRERDCCTIHIAKATDRCVLESRLHLPRGTSTNWLTIFILCLRRQYAATVAVAAATQPFMPVHEVCL